MVGGYWEMLARLLRVRRVLYLYATQNARLLFPFLVGGLFVGFNVLSIVLRLFVCGLAVDGLYAILGRMKTLA